MLAKPGEEDRSQAGALADLETFQIRHAKVVVDDRVLNTSWLLPRFDVALDSVESGLYVNYSLDFPSVHGDANEEAARFEGDLDFNWGSKKTHIESKVTNFDIALLAQKIPELSALSGHDVNIDGFVIADFDAEFSLEKLIFNATSKSGSVHLDDNYEEAIAYEDFALEMQYDPAQEALYLEQFDVHVNNIPIVLSGEVRGAEEKYSGILKANIAAVEQAKIDALWPRNFTNEGAYEWIVEKLGDGSFQDLNGEVAFSLQKDDAGEFSFSLEDANAFFSFDGMSVDYRVPLTKVEQAKGKGAFNYKEDSISIDIDSAKAGDLNISKAKLLVTKVIEEGEDHVALDINLSGPLQSVFRFIEKEPIEVKPPFDVSKIKGSADLAVKVDFPTHKDLKVEDIKLDIKGTAKDVLIPGVVKNLDLTKGPFAVAIKGNDLNISGKGELAGRPVNVKYHEFLKSAGQKYSSKVEASLVADPNLRAALGVDLSEFLEGSAGVDIVYTETGDNAVADINADLSQSRLFFEPLKYEKAIGVKGAAQAKAYLNNGVLTQVDIVSASAPQFKMDASEFKFREAKGETELSRGKISRVTMGETIGLVDFEILPSKLMKLVFTGQVLDARPFLDDEEEKLGPKNDPPMQISVAADTMRTADEETVQYAKLYLDIDSQGRFNQLEMDAIAGKGDIYMRYKPDETGKRIFRFEADDAGAALKAFQVYDNIVGGKMVIYGEPEGGYLDRNIKGTAEILDFKVVKAPSLARLISALSLGGIVSALNNEGLVFTRLISDFEWVFRPEGSMIVLENGRTSGNSLGLTFEGSFDNAANKIDISGTIVPLSEVNSIIGQIPLVGDILTGGSGGIFAATYTVKGEGKEPEVFVNPLSVLAPGILRRILFEN